MEKTTPTAVKDLKLGDIMIGDQGGRSEIIGEVEGSNLMMGMVLVETEHGTLYLDPDFDMDVIAYSNRNNWDNDNIQFPRLIDECAAVLHTSQLNELEVSMDLDTRELLELFERAQNRWDAIKSST